MVGDIFCLKDVKGMWPISNCATTNISIGGGKVSFESCNYQNEYILYDESDGFVKKLAVTPGDFDKEEHASWKIEREPQTGQYK